MVRVPVVRLDPDLPLPGRAHDGDAGYDLRAREGAVIAAAGGRAVVPTGVALAIPDGWCGLVLPRSGLALRHGVTCLNAPGLIDAGYRDEVKIILVNHDPTVPFTVQRGDRIAQILLARAEPVHWEESDGLGQTGRGLGGFGSTGVR